MLTLGSLFSGIGGIDLAFQCAGFEVAWQVEIDKACRGVLARHWPDVPKFEDVREVGKKQLSRVDVIAGGFPCQDLSVAGRREGLSGERSGLFWEMLRIVDELRPRFLVWENVPGLLSSHSGRDFPAIFRGLADCGYFGCARTLDARFFGVPQRRRRVFGVFARGHSGAERCAEILSLRESLCGHTPARQEAGQAVAATLRGRSASRGVSEPGRGGEDDQNIVIAPTIPARTKVGGGLGTDFDCDGGLIVGSVSSKWAKGSGGPAGDECQNLVAHTLRSEGADASEDGTGRGTPLVTAFTIHSTNKTATVASETSLAGSLKTKPPGSQENSSTTVVLHPFAFQTRIARNGRGQPKETVDALTSSEGGSHADSKPHVATMQGVRRLTPRECERLQGLHDDWTRWLADGREQKDGPRYRQIGNGVAVPCLNWIAERIANVLNNRKA